MYNFEIINFCGACVWKQGSYSLGRICEKIYNAVCHFLGDDSFEAVEASSWAELYCGTIDDPACYDMEDYSIYFWWEE